MWRRCQSLRGEDVNKLRLVAGLAVALLLIPGVAAKPKSKGTPVTELDVQTCIGANDSSPEEQIVACTKLLDSGKIKHPAESDYYATRGAAYQAADQIDKALADLNKAISIRQAPEFYFQRASTHMAKGNVEAAKADLQQVLKVKPDYAPAYMMGGVIAYQTGNYEEAVKFFNSAVERVPTHYQAIFSRGAAKKKLGDESGGNRDIADAKGMSSHVEKDMAAFGITP